MRWHDNRKDCQNDWTKDLGGKVSFDNEVRETLKSSHLNTVHAGAPPTPAVGGGLRCAVASGGIILKHNIRLAKLKGAAGPRIYLFFKKLEHRYYSVEFNADSVVFQF
jgi:hypothetical protein